MDSVEPYLNFCVVICKLLLKDNIQRQSVLCWQCSPHQAVAGKIYRLKHSNSYCLQPLQGLLKLNELLKKIIHNASCDLIQSDQGNEIYQKTLKYTQLLLLWTARKVLESNICKLMSKDNNCRFCPSLHYPPPPTPSQFPPGKCTSGAFFALPAMNGPLPAELKFKGNTGCMGIQTCKIKIG